MPRGYSAEITKYFPLECQERSCRGILKHIEEGHGDERNSAILEASMAVYEGRLRVILLTTLLAVPLGQTASAAVFSESFNYSLGGLNGQGGWTATSGATVVDPAPDVIVNGTNGGNRALQLVGQNADIAVHTFAAQTGDVFFSFVFRFDAGVLSNNDFLGLWIDDGTSTGDHTTVPSIGLKVNQGGSGTLDYFVRVENGAEAYSTLATLDVPVQVVGRLYKDGPSLVYNKFALWINPDGSDLNSPDAVATLTPPPTGLSSVSRLGFRTATLAAGDQLLVDELMVTTNFQEVILPEPATLGIWAGVCLGTLIGAHRRKSLLRS
jgi:hypothetical protein